MDAAAFGYETDDGRWPVVPVKVPPIQTAKGVAAYLSSLARRDRAVRSW